MSYRYLSVALVIFSLPLTASVLPHKNYHPAFKMLPLEALGELNAQVADEVPLLDADMVFDADQLHHSEAHPADWATLVGVASFDFSSLEVQNPERPMPPGSYLSFSLTVDRQQYYLSVVEVFTDREKQFRYVTAKLVDHKGHARFVVSNRSGHIAARLSINGANYRLLSRQTSASQQLIYRLKPAATQQGKWGNTVLLSTSSVQGIHHLESELLRTELLLQIAPTYYSHSASETLITSRLRGRDLGHLDASKIKKGAISEEISNYLSQFKLLTQSAEDDVFFVTKVRKNDERVIGINFIQLVQGAAFEYTSGISIRTDGQVGGITLHTMNSANGSYAPPRYSHQQVLDIAMEKLKAYVDSDELPLGIKHELPPYMKYFYKPEDQSIHALWLVTIFGQKSTADESYLVIIDDRTGGVTLTRGKSEPY